MRLKFFIFLSGLVLSANAYGKRPEWSGTYRFTGEIQTLQAFHEPVVWAGNEDGRTLIRKYREDGYACEHRYRQFHLCKKFIKPHTPDEILAEIADEYGPRASVEFGERYADDQLVHNGEVYKQWAVFQPIAFAGQNHRSFRWIDMGDVFKVEMGDFTNGTGESLVSVEGGFHWMKTVRRQRYAYTVVLVLKAD